jgi:hypothetical protein
VTMSSRSASKMRTSDVQLHIGESRDFGFDASHRPGMTATYVFCPNLHLLFRLAPRRLCG